MKLQAIALTTLLTIISVACGRPNPDDYRSQGTTGAATNQATGKDTKTADATKKPVTGNTTANNATTPPAATPTPTPTPSATPPALAPKRTVANAAEIAQAKTDYAANCAGCHRALDSAMGSAKKGSTAEKIQAATAAPAPQPAINAHAALATAMKWPKDTVDESDDGVDQAVLKAKAMAEALK